ncbi:hypothetical protein ACJIZ3_011766 [Penstemon smallii]|uniref:Bifunctional inhibitor/plant lipid transfer protein/seed storage helical domain-containing protein n=1 Tax=Penstemon smallii TaxID=265156 RepID=A0ABD3UK16_9LAMI
MDYSCMKLLLATLFVSSIFTTNAQISTPCTSSMITSFTPCLNFVTGSSGTGSSPTKECCDSVKSLMEGSMDCTCLIITGNVPVSIPFVNRSLAISLPRVCQSSVPIQCKSTGVPLPAPGPVLFGPPLPPAASAPHSHSHSPASAPHSHSHSPKGSKAVGVAAPPTGDQILDFSPVSPPESTLGPSANPGIRPVVRPNSASNKNVLPLQSLLVMLMGIIYFKFF